MNLSKDQQIMLERMSFSRRTPRDISDECRQKIKELQEWEAHVKLVNLKPPFIFGGWYDGFQYGGNPDELIPKYKGIIDALA